MALEPDRLHDALAALAPPRRFQLLLLLLGGVDRSVSQLAAAVKLSQSCTTRHLQALERAGLVKGVRDGKRVVFRPQASDAPAAAVLATLSTAGPALAPLADPRPSSAAAPDPAPDVPAPEPAAAHRGGESGNKSGAEAPLPQPRPRPRQELEDYLL